MQKMSDINSHMYVSKGILKKFENQNRIFYMIKDFESFSHEEKVAKMFNIKEGYFSKEVETY